MPGRVLVVENRLSSRVMLKCRLSAAHYEVLEAASESDVFACARDEKPDLIILSGELVPVDGPALCCLLKGDPSTNHIPLLVLSGRGTGAPVEMLEVGADDFLPHPHDGHALLLRVGNLMRTKLSMDELRLREETARALGRYEVDLIPLAGGEMQASVILVGPPDCLELLRLGMQTVSNITVVSDIAKAVTLARATLPDVILIWDQVCRDADGLRLIAQLRSGPETRHIGIIHLVAAGGMAAAALALEIGANDFILAPFDALEVVGRIRLQLRRKRASEQLRANLYDGLRMAILDPLTGLYNRRYATNHLRNAITRSPDIGQSYAVMMMDIDHFKRVNDRFGHVAGDEVLVEFSNRLRECLRGFDLISRIGGEEFLVMMTETDHEQAARVAERVRVAVEDRPYPLQDSGQLVTITASIGVTMFKPGDTCPDALIQRADQALFSSKKAGRNCVRFYSGFAA